MTADPHHLRTWTEDPDTHVCCNRACVNPGHWAQARRARRKHRYAPEGQLTSITRAA